MKVALIAALSGALVAVGAQALPGAIGSPEDSGSLVWPAASRTTDTTETAEDRTERARTDDDRTETAEDRTTTTEDTTTTAPTTTAPQSGVDISGPCDEAEHANDPRCTGAAPQRRDDDGRQRRDNSGPGSSNSGPGSRNSGRGGNGGDDDSGHGRGRGRGRGGDD